MAWLSEKLPSGRYQAKIRRKGHKPLSKTFATKAARAAWVKQEESKIELGMFETVDKRLLKDVNDDFERNWIEKKKGVTRAARDSEAGRLAMWTERLGHKRIGELKVRDIVDVCLERLEKRTSDTVRREVVVLSGALNHSLGMEDEVKDNVAKRALRYMNKKNILQRYKPRTRRLEEGEYDAILAQFDTNPMMAYAFRFTCVMGLRQGELAGMQWQHVNKENMLHLPHTKTEDDVTIPLLPEAITILDEMGRKDVGPVFGGSKGHSMYTAFRRACTRAKVGEGLTWHDLRREAASRMFEMGFEIQEVATITRHKDWRMLKVYTQIKADVLRAKAERATNGAPVEPMQAEIIQIREYLQTLAAKTA